MGLQVQHLSKTFTTRNGMTVALEDVTFRLRDHEILCLVGPSGCGKTTLLKIIAGILQPSSGEVIFERPSALKPRAALVFQDHGLFPWMNVLDNIAFGLEMRGVGRAERTARARDYNEKIGLASFERHFPHELSIGMQQRVGIARAFIVDGETLLMDEPFGSLDAQTKQVLRDELLTLWSERQQSIVFVTHDIEEAILLGDRVLVMSSRPGHIREEIPVALKRPRGIDSQQNETINELKWHIWKMLERQVRTSLSIPA